MLFTLPVGILFLACKIYHIPIPLIAQNYSHSHWNHMVMGIPISTHTSNLYNYPHSVMPVTLLA